MSYRCNFMDEESRSCLVNQSNDAWKEVPSLVTIHLMVSRLLKDAVERRRRFRQNILWILSQNCTYFSLCISFHKLQYNLHNVKVKLGSSGYEFWFLACRLKKASSGCAEVTLRTLYFFLVVRFYFFDTTLTNHIFSNSDSKILDNFENFG